MRRTDRNSSWPQSIQAHTTRPAPALCHAVERGATVQPLDVALVARACTMTWSRSFEGDAAHRCDLRRQRSFHDRCGAQPEVLLNARADSHLAAVAVAVAYTGTSIMSMNGDLAGLSNLFPGTIGSW